MEAPVRRLYFFGFHSCPVIDKCLQKEKQLKNIFKLFTICSQFTQKQALTNLPISGILLGRGKRGPLSIFFIKNFSFEG